MKKKSIYIGLAVVAIAVAVILPTHVANGFLDMVAGIGDVLVGAVFSLFAFTLQILFQLAGWLLVLCAALLNISIDLTMRIKEFVNSTQGIYIVWESIRDISSLFIIFLLLYTSFRMILGLDEKIGTLIKNIVIAGILINFSFFLTGILIDASNVVSLALYSAISPTPVPCQVGSANYLACSSTSITDPTKYVGGLSAIIINSLKVTSIASPKLTTQDTPQHQQQ